MNKYLKLLISIAIPLIIGYLGSFFTAVSVTDWYTTINKPPFNPPNWIFAPVWTLLFILIGLSFYLVWSKDFAQKKKLCLTIYSIQLILNLLWSALFFGLRNPLLGLVEIFVLWLSIITNITVFYRISRASGYLLIPYLLWVSFATILNFSIVILN